MDERTRTCAINQDLHSDFLKEARNMIPKFDSNSRNRVREFLNAASYAMKNIHLADE